MANLRKTLFLGACVCFFTWVEGQEVATPRFRNLSVGGHFSYGSFITADPKAAFVRDSYSYFGELYLQHQTDGSKPWHHANGLPQWGVGVQYGNLGSKQYVGDLLAAFCYLRLRLFTLGSLQSKVRLGAGGGWVEKIYDPKHNHKNVLTGSHLNAFLNFLWLNEVRLSAHWYLSAGAGFSHLSNGGVTLPNLGVNIPTLQLGARYAFHDPLLVPAGRPDSFSSKLTYRVFASLAVKQYPWVGSSRYLIALGSVELSKRTSARHRFGGGTTLFYNPSLEIPESGLKSEKLEGNNVQGGVYAAYERYFGKLSFPIQLGVYVYNKDRFSALYQQIGLHYQLSEKLTAGFSLKTHLGKAEYINAGIGYTLN
jgi:hypothetical protein